MKLQSDTAIRALYTRYRKDPLIKLAGDNYIGALTTTTLVHGGQSDFMLI